MTPSETYAPATLYTDLRSWTLNGPKWGWVLVGRVIGWWFFATILINMGAPVKVEEAKFPPPKTWNERHSHGWDEWHIEKDEAIPNIKWSEE